MEICKKESCTGCEACRYACPKGCISMQPDEIGHLSAQIDEQLCVNCGKCKAVCPSINAPSGVKPGKAYAAICKDTDEYMSSASGGAAAAFSLYVIEQGGVVYGCTGTNGYDVHHIRVDNKAELWRLKGSKYVQSRIGDVHKQMEQDLKDGKKVLFIGTPCQVAGVKSLFAKYETLYTVDLICHGVPSAQLLKEHLQDCVKTDWDEVSFREKGQFVLKVLKEGKVLYYKRHLMDLYYTAFAKTLFYRHSCYTCLYANEKRVSDLTIGDFWGVKDIKTLPEHQHGLSVVLQNTIKGATLLEQCKDLFYTEEHPVEEAVAGNSQLRRPSFKHKHTERFRVLYPKLGFRKAAKKCLLVNRIKYMILAMYLKIRGR